MQGIYPPSALCQCCGTCCSSRYFRDTHFGTVGALFYYTATNLYCNLPLSARYAVCYQVISPYHVVAPPKRDMEAR